MAVVIPPHPAMSTNIELTSSSVDQKPVLGGPRQRVARLGDFWSYTVDLRPMHAWQSGPLIVRLLQGLSERVLCPVMVSGIDLTGQTDVTAVRGAGKSLVVDGSTAGKSEGQFFSLVKDGVRYLHMVASVAENSITFTPALKVAITGGEILEFAEPKIEGFLSGNSQGWTTGMVGNVGMTFRIEEAS